MILLITISQSLFQIAHSQSVFPNSVYLCADSKFAHPDYSQCISAIPDSKLAYSAALPAHRAHGSSTLFTP